MPNWVELAVAEDRLLLSLLHYALMLHPYGLQYGNSESESTLFTKTDADRLANLMGEWEDMAREMISEEFNPKKTKEYEAALKEMRSKMMPAWRAATRCGPSTIYSVSHRLGIRL